MSSPALDCSTIVKRLRSMQLDLRTALRTHMQAQKPAVWSRTVRDDVGDTIFGIDAEIEDHLLAQCRLWGKEQHFTLIAEGLDSSGVTFGQKGRGGPPFRLIVDPIDGTRGLMFDKRSAWCLMGVAPDLGPTTQLTDIEIAVMSELPTTRQACGDVLWAVRGKGTNGERHDFASGAVQPLPVVPSGSDSLQNSFATVTAYFPGGKELTARLEEAILLRAFGPLDPNKAEIYCDQYICSGGQLAEMALGRDRFVLDVRPLVHKKLGIKSSLCCRPYDLCAALVAQEALCVVCDPFGAPLTGPLDTTTNLAFAAYANAKLAAKMIPIVREAVQRVLG